MTQVLFVHGMGRSPLAAWPMLRRLRKQGLHTETFSYFVSSQSFSLIQSRLEKRIREIASRGDYVLIGHSLGGVLLRASLAKLGNSVRPPEHLFLLGSPIKASRLALLFSRYWIFRVLTKDCGALLSSSLRMQEIPASVYPTTAIMGVKGFNGPKSPFGHELNDGIVSVSEVSADWIIDKTQLPVVHSFLPSSRLVSEVILAKITA